MGQPVILVFLCSLAFAIIPANAENPKALYVTYDYVNLEELNIYNELTKKGFTVTKSVDIIPENMEEYDLVIVNSYTAPWKGTADYMKNYIANGGGAVILGGVPAMFPYPDSHGYSCYGYYDISYISDWFGSTSYANTGGTARITMDDPLDTSYLNGDILVSGAGFASAAVTNLQDDTQILAKWDTGPVFAFTHTYENGRVFYLASSGYHAIDELYLAGAIWAANVPPNVPPIADPNGPYTGTEGSPITFDASASFDPDGDTLTYRWDFDNDKIWDTDWSNNPTIIYTWYDDFSGTITVEVSDGKLSDIATAIVTVNNVAPIVDAGEDQTVNEGDTVIFSGIFSDPGTADTHTIEWDFGDGTIVTGTLEQTYIYADNGEYTATLTVTDDDGGVGTDTLIVTVNNVAPTITSLAGPIDPVEVNTAVSITGTFTDPGILDTHTATFDWNGGIIDNGTVTDSVGSGTVTGTHTYTEAGVYTVTLTVTDDDGGIDSETFQYVVVYDPEGGFVTGGGWINSLVGAYVDEPMLTGKATFGFVSKYKKGQTTPTGNTEFQFRAGNLNFHSSSYDWLVIAGPKAMYKGTGTINGVGSYGFILNAIDEELTPSTDVDMFRIKIWKMDNGDVVVYDNQIGADDDADHATTIQGGNIVIHK